MTSCRIHQRLVASRDAESCSPLIALVIVAAISTGPGRATPRNDFLLILDQRAGPYRYLANIRAGQAYPAALAAFGRPTSFRDIGNYCRVTWSEAGIRIDFVRQVHACSAGNLFRAAWYGMSLFGRQWRTLSGIHIGDSVARVRRLYPKAVFAPHGSQASVVVLTGGKQEEKHVRLAALVNRLGKVTSIEVPATYVY